VTTPLNTITATIPVGDNPAAMAVSPDSKRLYVANLGDRTVSVIDTTTNKVTATIPCPAASLYGAAVSPDGNHLYLSDVSSLLSPTRLPRTSTRPRST
jgi:YVTN family beta-propeller protein